MRRSLLIASLALVAQAAWAQPAPVFPGPGTLLRLSESAEVTRAPDEVRAVLRFEAREASAAAAQAAVNRAVSGALVAAQGVAGITATNGSYSTWRQEDPARWTASQSIELRAQERAPLLELAGQLQSRGFALGGIAHGLTRETARTVRQEAASLALEALRRRAEAIAAQLDMRVERIAEVQIDAPDQPVARPALAQPMAARAAPAPVSQSEDIVVTAVVQASVVLAPR